MRAYLLASLAAITGLVAATPVNHCPSCPTVISNLRKSSQTASATTFCSSYLHISTCTTTKRTTVTPTSTVTQTSTVTAPTSTAVVTVTTSTYDTTTATVTAAPSTVTETNSVTATSTISCFNAATTLTATTVVPVRRMEKRTAPTPSYFKDWSSGAISTACKCLSLTTPTSTVTLTSTCRTVTTTTTVTAYTTPVTTVTGTTITVPIPTTVTSTVTPPPVTSTVTANFAIGTPLLNGMNYYAYEHQNPTDYDTANAHLYPSSFQGNNAYSAAGVISDVDTVGSTVGSGGFCNMPNGQVACDHVAIVFQGFFFAATAGQYTFYTPNTIDNELLMWHGDIAYGANGQWTTANADYDADRIPNGYTSGSISLNLAAGEVLPITLIFGNSSPVSNLYYYITTPDGVQHTSSSGFFTPECAIGGPFVP